ncbi:leucine-rich repeat domain-containing protein, partial [Escherichia coli]|nr:leucine-rich repeat domain-containing protein [Escherichia coli]
PNAASLEALDLSFNDIGSIGDEAVEAIVRSPHLGRLKVLNLARNRLGRIGAEALAGWPHLPNMTEVNLTGCDIPDAARAVLLASPFADR